MKGNSLEEFLQGFRIMMAFTWKRLGHTDLFMQVLS